jgi:hypothetical protein
MATLSVPPVPTSPRDDAIALYRAFKGTLSHSLSNLNFYNNAFMPALLVVFLNKLIGT